MRVWTRRVSGCLMVGLMLAPGAALAHTGVSATHGFMHGFMHPLSGADHILSMIATGMFAANLGGRALWAVPCAFAVAMVAGGFFGMQGVALPYVETGIALSVIALGLAVACRWRAPVALAMALAGLFAIFHGHAHGAEMPADASGAAYAAGFLLATALLQATGIALGLALLGRGSSERLFRLSGAAMSLAGLALFIAAV